MKPRGLTLIELLVALAVLAVLGLLSWKATAEIANQHRLVTRELQRWQDIAATLQRIEQDLLQTVTLPPTAGAGPDDALTLSTDAARGQTLSALAFDASQPDILQLGYELRDGVLYLKRRPAFGKLVEYESHELLDGVERLGWRVLDASGWHTSWPPAGTGAPAVPLAIEFELELQDVGTVSRLVALR